MREQPLISADSHVVEPADLWSTRLDTAFRDHAPSLVMNPAGKKGLYFICDGLEPRLMSSAFASGVSPEALLTYHQNTSLEDGRAGGWDPAPRLVDMALDGEAAEALQMPVSFHTSAGHGPESKHKTRSRYQSNWKRQVYATFMDDAIGIELCHHVGKHTYMWASDDPHTQSTWPRSREVIA